MQVESNPTQHGRSGTVAVVEHSPEGSEIVECDGPLEAVLEQADLGRSRSWRPRRVS
ncbi:MAG: hypothetical protein J07HX64_02213 [halophilic archaeon J07HX64]|nr:MAG: hypothetical protein J07HX64_02213 [halophilic archaeon J07HX64]